MSNTADVEFSPEEVSSQAQGNATALALTALAYLKERGLDLDEYVAFHGRRFAPVWEGLRGRLVVEVAAGGAQRRFVRSYPALPLRRRQERGGARRRVAG
jgi:hypothetical protein